MLTAFDAAIARAEKEGDHQAATLLPKYGGAAAQTTEGTSNDGEAGAAEAGETPPPNGKTLVELSKVSRRLEAIKRKHEKAIDEVVAAQLFLEQAEEQAANFAKELLAAEIELEEIRTNVEGVGPPHRASLP